MTERNIKTYWGYFRALAEQLKRTEQFVDHMIDENKKEVNGQVFSNEFAKIIMLAASEFEVVGKALCEECGMIVDQTTNIKDISRELLTHFPKIGDTIIGTPYKTYQPLKEWHYDPSTDRVDGINWWTDHNHIKHDRNAAFELANLSNSIDAMASLMVLELYISQNTLGNLRIISSIGCDYFESEYQSAHMLLNTGSSLPDFSDSNNMNSLEQTNYNMDNGNPQIHLLKNGSIKKMEENNEIINGRYIL